MGKTKKYDYTRLLIKTALNDGLTQKEIADMCRVSQPIVSHWVNGVNKGTIVQLQPLINKYGHKIKRQTMTVYLQQELKEKTISRFYFSVTGEIIFKYTFFINNCSIYKFIIHRQQNQFILIVQKNIIFLYEEDRIAIQNIEKKQFRLNKYKNFEIFDRNEKLNWNSKYLNFSSASALLKEIDSQDFYEKELIPLYKYLNKANSNRLIIALQFLIRESFIMHNIDIDDVIEIK